MTDDRIAIGILGLGPAGRAMLPYIGQHPRFRLAAVCDRRSEALAAFDAADVATFTDVADMAADPGLHAVFVATPTWLHAEHAIALIRGGKHVIVEKPMAFSLDEADAMIETAKAENKSLIVGHSQSFEPALQVMKAVVDSGRLGRLTAINGLNYSDWMFRPRLPQEFDRSKGGGVVFRQAAHHVDVVRYVAGGSPESISAFVGDWRPDRPGDGSYSALLRFRNGVVATLFYSGYGHFSSSELTFGINESGRMEPQSQADSGHRRLDEQPADRDGAGYAEASARRTALLTPGTLPATFGLLIVSCEGGDMRVCPDGVKIYGDQGQALIPIEGLPQGRNAVLDELADVMGGSLPTHGGEWGKANLELCLAMLESAGKAGQVIPVSNGNQPRISVPKVISDHLVGRI